MAHTNHTHSYAQGQTPFDLKTYSFTLSWLTRASIRALAPLVGQTEYPESFVLDNQLEVNPAAPNIWVKPTEGKYAPLRRADEGEKIPNYKGKRNAFFAAVKKWRPTLEIAALGLDTGYRLQFVLDKENGNRYVHTLLILTKDGGMQAGALPVKQQKGDKPVVSKKPFLAKKQFKPTEATTPKRKPVVKYEKRSDDIVVD